MKGILKVFLISVVCFLIADSYTYAQTFKISGVVFDKDTRLRIALAEIHNLRTGSKAGSNDMGMFTMSVQVGDSLLVYKRNYQEKAVIVASDKDILVYLDRGAFLREVEIKGENKAAILKDMQQEYKNKGSFYMGKPPLLSFLFKPITAIYELVGKTPRDARRFNRMYVTEVQQSHVDQLYNKALIQKETGLTGNELEDFMVEYRPDYQKTLNWNAYDGIKYIRDSYKAYKLKQQ